MGERVRGQLGAREHCEIDFFDMVRLMGDRLTDSLHAVETLVLNIAYEVTHDAPHDSVACMTHDLTTMVLTAQIHNTTMHDIIHEMKHAEEGDLGLDQRLVIRTKKGPRSEAR